MGKGVKDVFNKLAPIKVNSGQAMGTTVTEDRLRQKGYVPFLEYYLNARYGDKTKPSPK